MQVADILKKSSNRGAILISRNLDCQNEFKVDLDQIGLLNSTNIGFGMNSVEPTVNNFRVAIVIISHLVTAYRFHRFN